MSVISQLLNEDNSCTDILAILLDFTPLESLLYFHILQNGEKTVTQLCEEADRKQSTVHVALQNLVSRNICMKKKRNKKPRGYEYVYIAVDSKKVQKILTDRLEKLYRYTKACIQNFERKAPSCQISFY